MPPLGGAVARFRDRMTTSLNDNVQAWLKSGAIESASWQPISAPRFSAYRRGTNPKEFNKISWFSGPLTDRTALVVPS